MNIQEIQQRLLAHVQGSLPDADGVQATTDLLALGLKFFRTRVTPPCPRPALLR